MNLVRFQKPAYGFNVNTLMNDMLNDFPNANYKERNHFRPAVNIREIDDAFIIDLMIPGYSKENISVKNKDGVLTVKADVKKEKDISGYNRCEFVANAFERSFKLPENVDSQSILAKYVDGVLSVNIPKKEIDEDQKELNIEIE